MFQPQTILLQERVRALKLATFTWTSVTCLCLGSADLARSQRHFKNKRAKIISCQSIIVFPVFLAPLSFYVISIYLVYVCGIV